MKLIEIPNRVLRHARFLRRFLCPLRAGLACLIGILAGCNPPSEAGPAAGGTATASNGNGGKARPLLQPSVSEIDFGVVAAGEQKDATFKLTNHSAAVVEVARVKTSCNCLRVELNSRSIHPAETVEAKALLDLRVEADFRGNLGIEVEGLGTSGEKLFGILVLVSVPRENKGGLEPQKGSSPP